jgi:hypothetical protein
VALCHCVSGLVSNILKEQSVFVSKGQEIKFHFHEMEHILFWLVVNLRHISFAIDKTLMVVIRARLNDCDK